LGKQFSGGITAAAAFFEQDLAGIIDFDSGKIKNFQSLK
jgi:hypothetical protein